MFTPVKFAGLVATKGTCAVLLKYGVVPVIVNVAVALFENDSFT